MMDPSNMDDLRLIRKPSPRVDVKGRVTGKAIYTTGVKIPDMLFRKVLRRHYSHARIPNFDTPQCSPPPACEIPNHQ
jgi:CO/xanthine dehydrogenase Mo-binding subunit